jgi:hypothetical protein
MLEDAKYYSSLRFEKLCDVIAHSEWGNYTSRKATIKA